MVIELRKKTAKEIETRIKTLNNFIRKNKIERNR